MSNTNSSRPILPASSSEFALPSSPSSAPIQSTDEFNPLLFRFRRPSLLAFRHVSESRLSSPLTTSFTSPLTRSNLESASARDKEPMWTDSSPSSSENATPPILGSRCESNDSDSNMKTSRPQTPPRNSSSHSMEALGDPPERLSAARRLSYPVRIDHRIPCCPTEISISSSPKTLAFYILSLNLVQMRMKSNQKHNSSASLRHFPSCPRSLERHERHRTAVDTPRRLKKSLRERTHQATTATTTATHLHSGYLLLATPSVSASLAPLPVVSRVASTEMICLLTARAVRWQWK